MTYGRVLPPGTVIDNEWRIERVLGEGGFGITYAALNLRIGGVVALKEYLPSGCCSRNADTSEVLPAEGKEGEVFRWGQRRFIREAETLAKLDHPSIVRVEGFFEANRTAYIVLEFVEGGTLKGWLRDLGRKPTQSELDQLLDRLTDALSQVHALNLLHRDIKPDNIMLRSDGTPVLIDFGAAKASIAGHTREVAGAQSMVAKTLAIVSDGYSPPEQYASQGKLQGPFTDVYALGATVYRAIVGSTPQPSAARVLSDSYRPLANSAVVGKYRQSFLEGIDRALGLHREARPQSMEELRRTLGLGGEAPATELEDYEIEQVPTTRGHSTLPLQSRSISAGVKPEAPAPNATRNPAPSVGPNPVQHGGLSILCGCTFMGIAVLLTLWWWFTSFK